mmetsp:Transcript_19317/g.41488  ORF Transcript_19317/g.41488 Transcript_19317/m.41488 type:complete len:122 (-) Transcript_19317:277-642(-)|eukprot:CAMPEP_0194748006 /NCGR_PEP_ID=MMETSP0323_2-20130528/2224_1 /TAXON_ID=2866 ORGANISM="Crypthecodinium cohnii, Strain Seligo" /NCGR_SAMPLE_ID=MMETSP0323_2 /ASSEMBLY_ACC=CAM_ASM_000346 /LENGTH=121 /DNA_ID=CAMNT_0039661983 /DNA_START=68 /DNA_END=433 /DNA_ORIENTATION=-
MSASQDLIQQLLQAEKEAEALIATAKKNRLTKLKQAKDKAEEEMKTFREEQEKKFQKEMGAKAAADPGADQKAKTAEALAQVNSDYTKNKDRTIKYVIEKVLDVPTSLTDTQKQALKVGAV